MKDGNRAEELQRLIKGGEFRKPKCEVPLGKGAERQCHASITGCYTEPVMDPVDIIEQVDD